MQNDSKQTESAGAVSSTRLLGHGIPAMVFDVESIGLHGDGYAVGYVVIQDGNEVESGMFACPASKANGADSDRLWVYENIPQIAPDSPDPLAVRENFWCRWMEWKAKGALLAADCAWPVEARFLAACVDAAYVAPLPRFGRAGADEDDALLVIEHHVDVAVDQRRAPHFLPRSVRQQPGHRRAPQLREAIEQRGLEPVPRGRRRVQHRGRRANRLEAVELTMEQLYVLVGTYMSVENLIFNSLFPTRKGNNYCFPLNNVLLEKHDLDRVRLNKETWKYAALNLYHLRDFGTLEFRHHPGTKSVHELLKWIQILGNLYTWAQKTSLKDFKTLLMNLNTTSEYMEYVHQALPNLSAKVCTDDMYHAVTAAKVFVNSVKG